LLTSFGYGMRGLEELDTLYAADMSQSTACLSTVHLSTNTVI